jgi:hypothetical protein
LAPEAPAIAPEPRRAPLALTHAAAPIDPATEISLDVAEKGT